MSKVVIEKNTYEYPNWISRMVSAMTSGLIEPLISHPIDVAKTMQQANNTTFTETMKNMLKGGTRTCYAGIIPKVIGNVPMRGVFWVSLYEFSDATRNHKSTFVKYILPGICAGFVQTFVDNYIEIIKIALITSNKTTQKKYFIGFPACALRNMIFAGTLTSLTLQKDKLHINTFQAASLGGFIGSIVTQPLDVVKTIQQSNINHKDNMIKIMIDLVKNQGLSRLWTGWHYRSIMAFVNMGIGMTVYDFLRDKI